MLISSKLASGDLGEPVVPTSRHVALSLPSVNSLVRDQRFRISACGAASPVPPLGLGEGIAGRRSTTSFRDWSEVPVADIAVTESPRLDGENDDHVRLLAESEAVLPPDNRAPVDDAGDRRRAPARVALDRGDERIKVRFFDGAERDAFVLACRSTPCTACLSTKDDRIGGVEDPDDAPALVGSHGRGQGRARARRRRVATPRLSGEQNQLDARIGRDGRMRPLDQVARRGLAEDFIKRNPDASLRTIARAVGISPETARSVRNELPQWISEGRRGRGGARRRHLAPVA